MKFLDSARLDEAAAELDGESDRAAAIVGATIVERELTDLLLGSLLDVKESRELTGEFAEPLSTFYAKTKTAYAMGVISAELHADLNRVRKVRNLFAHEHRPLSFDDQTVSDHVRAFECLSSVRSQLKRYRSDPDSWTQVQAHKWNTMRKQWDIAIGSLVTVIRAKAHYQPRPDPKARELARLNEPDREG
jgi:hypothetical protein